MSTLRRNEVALSDIAFRFGLNGAVRNVAMLRQLTCVLDIQIATMQGKQRTHSLDLLAQDTQTLAAKKRAELQSFFKTRLLVRRKQQNAWRSMRT